MPAGKVPKDYPPPPPRHLDGLSARPVASVSRRPHEVGRIEGLGLDALEVAERASRSLPKATAKLNCTIGDRAGELVAQGSIIQCRRARRPGPASAASRSLQKIVGAIVGAASRAGREHLQGSSPPDSTLSRIQGDLDVRVPRRSARARASVRRWPWSSRRGRNVQVKLIKMGGRLVRHSRRLIFQLSEVSVPRRLFEGVLDRIGRLSPAPS